MRSYYHFFHYTAGKCGINGIKLVSFQDLMILSLDKNVGMVNVEDSMISGNVNRNELKVLL